MEKSTKYPIAKSFKEIIEKDILKDTAPCKLKEKFSSLISKDYLNCIIKPPNTVLPLKNKDYIKKRITFFEQKAIKLINNDNFIEFIKSFTRIFWLAKIRFISDIDKFDNYKSLEHYKHNRNLVVLRFQEYLFCLSVYHFLRKLEKSINNIEDKIHKKITFKSPDAIINLFNIYSKKYPGLLISTSFKKAIFLLLDSFDLDRYWFKSITMIMLTGKFFLPIPEDILDIDINFDKNNKPSISIGLGRDLKIEDLVNNQFVVKQILKDYYGKKQRTKKRDIEKEVYILNRMNEGKTFKKAYFEVEKVLGFDKKETESETFYSNLERRVYRTKKELNILKRPVKKDRLYGNEILSQIFDGDLEKFL
ncbi:MAG: hypothetical protein ACYDIA_02200 [Candidatus Humimicrobiaceae bacterium]